MGAVASLLVFSAGLVAQGCSDGGSGGALLVSAAGGVSTAAAHVAPPAGNAWDIHLLDPAVVQGTQSVLRLEITNGFGAKKSLDELKFKFDNKKMGYTLVRAVPPPGWILDKQKDDEFKFKADSGAAKIPPGGSVVLLLYVIPPATASGDVFGDTFKDVKAKPAKDEKKPVSGVPTWTRHSFQSTLDAAPTTLSVGDTLTLTLTVTNRLTATKSAITPAAPTVTGTATFALLSGPSPATASLASGATGTFTWTYQATSNGTSVFESSASSSSGSFASSPPARSPPVVVSDFSARLSLNPTGVLDGGTVTVTMIVENRTGAKLFGITPGALTNLGGATATLLTGPTPASSNIRNDSSAAFTWTYLIGGWDFATYQFQGSALGPAGLETNMALSPEGRIVNVTAVANPSLVASGATNVDIAFTVTNGTTKDLKEFKFFSPNSAWTQSASPFGNDTSGWKTGVKTKNGIVEYKFKEDGTKLRPGESITFTISFGAVPTVTAFRTDIFSVEFKGGFDGFTSAPVTIAAPPTITAFVPGEGPWGAVIDIIGTNFDPNLVGNTVTFSSGVTATVLAASTTQLTVVVPTNAVTGTVSVTTGASTAISPVDFIVLKGKPNRDPPIALAMNGWVLAVATDPRRSGRAYLSFAAAAPRLTVLDTTGAMAFRDIVFGGIGTQGLAVPRRGTTVYVTDSATYRLTEVDTDTDTVTNSFVTGVFPYGVALTQGDTRATVCNIWGFSVSVLKLTTGTGVELPLGADTNPQFAAPLPGDRDVMISHWYSGLLSRVDTAVPSVTDQITIGPTNDQGYEEIVITKGKAFLTQYLTNEVVVVDLTTRAVVGRIPTGLNPFGIALTPDETEAWVANLSGDTITIIDTATLAVTGTIPLPGVSPFMIDFDPGGAAIIGGNSVVVKIE